MVQKIKCFGEIRDEMQGETNISPCITVLTYEYPAWRSGRGNARCPCGPDSPACCGAYRPSSEGPGGCGCRGDAPTSGEPVSVGWVRLASKMEVFGSFSIMVVFPPFNHFLRKPRPGQVSPRGEAREGYEIHVLRNYSTLMSGCKEDFWEKPAVFCASAYFFAGTISIQ